MIKPNLCPYCMRPTTDMREIRVQKAPDEMENGGIFDANRRKVINPKYEVTDCYRLDPCKHIFKQKDVELVKDGELHISRLGDRVINPAHDGQ